MSLKRIFPLIILLVTLSLIGIIFIQVSWIKSMALVKEEQLQGKVYRAMKEVSENLLGQTKPSTGKRSLLPNPNQQFSWDLINPAPIARRYTTFELQEKLLKAFKHNSLSSTPFEFAITSSPSNGLISYFERKSPGFDLLVEDSVKNMRFVYPIVLAGGNMYDGFVPEETLIIVVPNVKRLILEEMSWMIAGAVVFTLIIIAAFYLTVNTMLQQKNLSEIKNDFINNMTHELKTPLATISLAADALRTPKVQANQEKLDYFTGIIKDENKRMNKQVEAILQSALLEKQEIQLNLRPVHAHDLLQQIMDNFQLQFLEKGASVTYKWEAARDHIQADDVHFTNLISNLIDNAIKYSKESLALDITTQMQGKKFIVRIEDNGIGMSKETVRRIFEKFYRAHTGNIHNVKGFGLGLSYVKTMVEAHGGRIKAESALGKGSVFTLEFPLLTA